MNLLLLLSGSSFLPSSAFSPLNLTSLHTWHDASDATTITHVGGSVSQWNDKSGNAIHATQPNASHQPQTGIRTINSLNALDFDGTNDFMVLPSSYYSIGAGNNAIFAVIQFDSLVGERRLVQGNVGAGSRNALYWNATQIAGVSNSTFSIAVNTRSPGTTQPRILSMRRNGASVDVYQDNLIGTTTGTGGNVTIDGAWFGSFQGASFFFDGAFCEIVTMKAHPTASEVTNLTNYFNAKWGTTA